MVNRCWKVYLFEEKKISDVGWLLCFHWKIIIAHQKLVNQYWNVIGILYNPLRRLVYHWYVCGDSREGTSESQSNCCIWVTWHSKVHESSILFNCRCWLVFLDKKLNLGLSCLKKAQFTMTGNKIYLKKQICLNKFYFQMRIDARVHIKSSFDAWNYG